MNYTTLKQLLGAKLGEIIVEDEIVSPVYNDSMEPTGVVTYETPDDFDWEDPYALENVDLDSLMIANVEIFR